MASVILLTGPSSAGKTSIGEALRRVLPRPTVFLNGDDMNLPEDSEARKWIRSLDFATIAALEDEFHAGFYGALAALARSGLHAVGEVLFKKPEHLSLFEEATHDVSTVLVHVSCAEDIRVQRELARRDRPPGTAVATGGQEWLPPRPDLVIDTAPLDALQAATMVRDHPRLTEESPQ